VRRALARVVRIVGWIVYLGGGGVGLFGVAHYIDHYWGTLGVIAAVVLFPVALTVAPIVSVFTEHSWALVWWTFGVGLLGSLLLHVGGAIDPSIVD
jgi:hypothetical protein